ncbi:MAG: YraN family protein [Rhodospirillales bacterium]|nr:YraN family protein [Rhodospirillales bacterium]
MRVRWNSRAPTKMIRESRGERKRRAERAGRWAETLAAASLTLRGWRILARRFRCPAGELDLVARRGSVLAIVEVKARRTRDDAAWAVTPASRLRLRRAAAAYLARNPELARLALRFDAMLVTPWAWPRHLAGAWDDGAAPGDL